MIERYLNRRSKAFYVKPVDFLEVDLSRLKELLSLKAETIQEKPLRIFV